MSKTFVPGANRTAQYWAGKFIGSTMNTNCACLHTTEGFNWPRYRGGASAPHLTILPNIKAKTVTMRQHYPANKSSRALVNLSGGVETNTLNVFQIELIGTCDSRYAKKWGTRTAGVDYIYWPDAPQWLLEAIAPVFRWLDAQWPNFNAADATPRGWVKYPDSYGINARQRMTFAEWRNAYGIFGHQHVPENTHGDPGNFPIAALIAAVAGTPATIPEPTPEPQPLPPSAQTAVWDLPSTWAIGSTGPAVTKLGQRLRIHAAADGRTDPYQVGPGPTFTATDREGVAAFQYAQGWRDADADGYPGPETFRRLAADPVVEVLVETISANLAGYDSKHGKRNRVQRARTTIPDYLAPKRPMWFHFQECAIDMFPELDKRLPEYVRVPEGGKGRESYYRKDAGIEIIEARLLNVSHMLLKDTKEHLVIVWEKDGHRAVDVNFHNENEGSTFQPLQLWDVLKAAADAARRHDVDARNILVTGDANFKGAAAFARARRWADAINSAAKKIDLQYHSTNGWRMRLVKGRRIDVDLTWRGADVREGEQLFGALIADHWPHRLIRRLFV